MDSTPEISQRHLAHRLGIALGVANLLMRNLAKKGHIRANQVGWKQWVYVLTPTGITWKVHLTLAYIDRFMGHYRRVRLLVQQDICSLDMAPDSRIAIYGTTELAELTYLALRDMGVTKIDFFDVANSGYRFLGAPVQAPESIDPNSISKSWWPLPQTPRRGVKSLIASASHRRRYSPCSKIRWIGLA